MRVVVADDSMLIRDGLSRLLLDAGCEVVGTAGDAVGLHREVELSSPDAVIVDIKMPPTHTDEGLQAARQIRAVHPAIGVLVLSQYLDSDYAMRLISDLPQHVGYLLKDRVSDIAIIVDAVTRLVEGECVIDPTIVSRLMHKKREASPMDALTERERTVLALVAEGRSNRAIAERLVVSPKTLEAHVHQIFQKLDLHETPDDHRRVLAVLAYLRSAH